MNSASQSAPAAERPAANPQLPSVHIESEPRLTRDQIKDLFLHELSHQERLLAILWYVEHMTPEEIALAIDSTPAQVQLNHCRIIQKLG